MKFMEISGEYQGGEKFTMLLNIEEIQSARAHPSAADATLLTLKNGLFILVSDPFEEFKKRLFEQQMGIFVCKCKDGLWCMRFDGRIVCARCGGLNEHERARK